MNPITKLYGITLIILFYLLLTLVIILYKGTYSEKEKNTYEYTNILSVESLEWVEEPFSLGLNTSSNNPIYYAYTQEDGIYSLLTFPLYKRTKSELIKLSIEKNNSETPKYKTGYKDCKLNKMFNIIGLKRYFCVSYRKLIVPTNVKIQKENS